MFSCKIDTNGSLMEIIMNTLWEMKAFGWNINTPSERIGLQGSF